MLQAQAEPAMTSIVLALTMYIVIVVLLLLAIIYGVRACATDARRRGQNPVLVAALVILFFPLGLIVWLVARPAPLDDRREKRPFRLDDYRVQ
jgi:cytochrome c oxidase assembly factor CtaG